MHTKKSPVGGYVSDNRVIPSNLIPSHVSTELIQQCSVIPNW